MSHLFDELHDSLPDIGDGWIAKYKGDMVRFIADGVVISYNMKTGGFRIFGGDKLFKEKIRDSIRLFKGIR